jgi:PAS domain S-box-containing protein
MKIDTNSPSTDDQVQDQHSQRRSPAVAAASAFPAGPINILIVDDEPKNLTVLETVLDAPDYRLVRAESADQALHALVVEEFALLILDIRLPGMNGFELAQMIKQRKKTAGVPIIFLTAYYNEGQHVLEGYETGAVDYLVKPVNPAILRSKVAVFAELHRKSRALVAEVTERRLVEEQLRELNDTLEQRVTKRTEALRFSEARYRDLIQALPAALYTTDERGRITLYNQAAVALWGHEPKIGRDLWCGSWKIYRPDGTPLPFDECPMAVTLRQGQPIRGEEIVIERPDGTKRHVLPHPEPLRDEEGAVVGAINMLIDITDRKQAEQMASYLAAIVTSSDDAIIGTDLLSIITSWNHAAEYMFGYTAKEMIGQPVNLLIPPERQDEESYALDQIMQGKLIRHYETIRRRKDGTELNISLTMSPVVDPQGRIIGASKISRNITDRKRAEEALRESEDRFHTLADNMAQFAWMADSTGSLFWYNQRWYEFTGTTFEEMQGWGWEKVHHPDHRDRVVKKWRQAHVSGEPWEDTFPLRSHDGTYRWFLSRAVPIRDAAGRIVRWFGTNTDISDLRETQASLRASEERLSNQTSELAKLNKDLEGFSYSVSHDLRAPLRTIDAFSRILEEEQGPRLDDEGRRSLSIVRKAVHQAGELIDDLLEFSKLGRQGMSFRLVNMADLAREAADDLRIMQEGRQVDLTIGDLPVCQGDRRFLKLVWINLLTNALKYTKHRKETRIEVGWHRREDFDGTGVGLAVVQRIVQRHDGRVWAEGKVDEGATFFVSLRSTTT